MDGRDALYRQPFWKPVFDKMHGTNSVHRAPLTLTRKMLQNAPARIKAVLINVYQGKFAKSNDNRVDLIAGTSNANTLFEAVAIKIRMHFISRS